MPQLNNDTHNLAVQASAYSLIKLLQANYPEVDSFYTENIEDKTKALEAQKVLIGLLKNLIDQGEHINLDEHKEQFSGLAVEGVFRMIEAINQIPDQTLSTQDKIKALCSN